MEAIGKVIEVDAEFAWVEAERATGCGTCGAEGGCGAGALTGLFGRRPVRLRTRNRIGARSGDRVVVAVEDSLVTRGSLAAYAVPLVGFLLGAGAGHALAVHLGVVSPDLLALILALAGLGLGASLAPRALYGRDTGADFHADLVRRLPVQILPGGL
jgi:sigma-E factor negative regulatory protein RseC